MKKKLGPHSRLGILLMMVGSFCKTNHHEWFVGPYNLLHEKYNL
jgi:hypothetical protein